MKRWKKLRKNRKLRKKWKHIPVSAYPMRYMGENQQARWVQLERKSRVRTQLEGLKHGTPVRLVRGEKAGQYGARVIDPNNIEHIVRRKDIEPR